MIPIRWILKDIARGVKRVAAEGKPLPPLFADAGAIAGILMGGENRRLRNQKKLGIRVPRVCMFSVTWKCNLSCVGCYAKRYRSGGTLDIGDIERIVREASDLGVFAFIIVGGEPLMVPDLISVLAANRKALFLLFTNGTLLNEYHVEQLRIARNVFPILSIEGPSEKTDARRGKGVGARLKRTMSLLSKSGQTFGFSSTITHANLENVLEREWLDEIWEGGARLGFIIDYIPFPHSLNEELILTGKDRAFKLFRLEQLNRDARPLLLNFPGDEYKHSGCQAAGKGFMHINADGFLEPCPFSHYASDNLKETSLVEALRSPFFTALRDGLQGLSNPKGECLLFARDEWVRQVAARTGAIETEEWETPGGPYPAPDKEAEAVNAT